MHAEDMLGGEVLATLEASVHMRALEVRLVFSIGVEYQGRMRTHCAFHHSVTGVVNLDNLG